jgi:hypothetical protein
VHTPASIGKLLGQSEWGEVDTDTFLRELASTMALELGCSRFGVRLAMDTALGRTLKTVVMYDRSRRDTVHVPDIIGDEVDDYLGLVSRCGGLSAQRLADEARLPAIVLDCLGQCDVRSLLETAISLNGMVYGTFSAESVRVEAAWTPHQLELMRRLALKTAPTLVRVMTEELTRPGELWEPGPSYWLAPLRAF